MIGILVKPSLWSIIRVCISGHECRIILINASEIFKPSNLRYNRTGKTLLNVTANTMIRKYFKKKKCDRLTIDSINGKWKRSPPLYNSKEKMSSVTLNSQT